MKFAIKFNADDQGNIVVYDPETMHLTWWTRSGEYIQGDAPSVDHLDDLLRRQFGWVLWEYYTGVTKQGLPLNLYLTQFRDLTWSNGTVEIANPEDYSEIITYQQMREQKPQTFTEFVGLIETNNHYHEWKEYNAL